MLLEFCPSHILLTDQPAIQFDLCIYTFLLLYNSVILRESAVIVVILGRLLFDTPRRHQFFVRMCVGCTIDQLVDVAEENKSSDGDTDYLK